MSYYDEKDHLLNMGKFAGAAMYEGPVGVISVTAGIVGQMLAADKAERRQREAEQRQQKAEEAARKAKEEEGC